jgi:hypothetical protein
MQSEQQLTQTQIKKSSVKKEKKPKTKSTDSVQNVDQALDQPLVDSKVDTTPQVVVDSTPQQVVELTPEEVVKLDIEEHSLNEQEGIILEELGFTIVLDKLNSISDQFHEFNSFFKNFSFSKEERLKIEPIFKKTQKSFLALQTAYYDNLSRKLSISEKNSGNRSNGTKKVQDKEKSAIHKKLAVHPFLLKFMKLDQGTLVSRSDALTAITGYVKQEKEINPDIIVESDKRSFKLIGELKDLFDGIEKVMRSKNLLENSQIPSEIKYTQIMEYMTHCFLRPDAVNVV